MAETSTPIAPEVYKHASRFVEESIVEQLIQSDPVIRRAEVGSFKISLIWRMFSLLNTNSN